MPTSRRTMLAALTALAAGALAGCQEPGTTASGRPSAAVAVPRTVVFTPTPRPTPKAPAAVTRAQVVARYGDLSPDYWGFGAPGVLRHAPAAGRVIALTFDACGGLGGSGYDQALIDFLRRNGSRRRCSSTHAGSTPTRPPSACWPLSRCSRSATTAPGTFRCRSPAGRPTASLARGTRARSTTRSPGTRQSSPACWASLRDSSGPAPPTATTSRNASSPTWESASSRSA